MPVHVTPKQREALNRNQAVLELRGCRSKRVLDNLYAKGLVRYAVVLTPLGEQVICERAVCEKTDSEVVPVDTVVGQAAALLAQSNLLTNRHHGIGE